MRPEIVAEPDCIHATLNQPQPHLGLEFGTRFEQRNHIFGLHHHVDQKLLHPNQLVGQRENGHLDIPENQEFIPIFFHEGFRIAVPSGSVRIGKRKGLDISPGFRVGQGIADHFDVDIALPHSHPVFIEPGAIGILNDPVIIRNLCSGDNHIAAHGHAQLVGADPVGDILIKVIGIMDGDIQLPAEIIR